MASSSPVFVGIDLGTSNSAVAVFDGHATTPVRTRYGSTLTPSVVRVDGRGQVTVGERARKALDGDPANTRSEFKRLMGTSHRFAFAAASTDRSAEELSAYVLESLREDVREQFGFLPARAVVSVPALFELPQSTATSEAARRAGFEQVELLQEPVASALAAGWQSNESGVWLVYDLGGGTFDASLLETRDGLLRVVGHDGDNFLGGRDFDWALVDWVLADLATRHGVPVQRSDPRHQTSLQKLKRAVEEVKMELTRAPEADLFLPGGFDLAEGGSLDVECTLSRELLERLCLPLVDRSLDVCRRLLAEHGLGPGDLRRVVLVGGPTVMPLLRQRVHQTLGAPVAEGYDPMTLVAQGAAIYAATAGLDARPVTPSVAAAPAGHPLWLHYPAMSSDLMPHLVGRVVVTDGATSPVATVQAVREQPGEGQPAVADVDGENTFVLSLELAPHGPNTFRLLAKNADGDRVAVHPETFTIVQGLTIGDPPLSRTVGVALANDRVHVYFERGAPLPARRTHRHRTVEGVAAHSSGCLLKIPIVQGEFEDAHHCRLVGVIEVSGATLTAGLPAGSEVEVTLELDRGGRLSARALVTSTGQVFEKVAALLVPDATPEVLHASWRTLQERSANLRGAATRRGDTAALQALAHLDPALAAARQDMAAAEGGDADAGQKARRQLLDLDARLEGVENAGRWPEVEDETRETIAWAASWVEDYGTPTEKRMLRDAQASAEQALLQRHLPDLRRQMRLVKNLGSASVSRDPGALERSFRMASARAEEASDLPRARALVSEGNRLLRGSPDPSSLRRVVNDLHSLLPPTPQQRERGFRSGVR